MDGLMPDNTQLIHAVAATMHGWHLWLQMAWMMMLLMVCTMTAPCPHCWTQDTGTSQKVYTTTSSHWTLHTGLFHWTLHLWVFLVHTFCTPFSICLAF